MFMGFMVITMSLTGWLIVHFSLTTLYIESGLLFLLGVMLTSLIFNVSLHAEQEKMDSAS